MPGQVANSPLSQAKHSGLVAAASSQPAISTVPTYIAAPVRRCRIDITMLICGR